jgi:orotidine-5'-phosphate decarboxylase
LTEVKKVHDEHRPTGRERILVALDVASLAQAEEIVLDLRYEVGGFKVGLELLTSEGSTNVVRTLTTLGCRLFYDGKFNDIPNTIAGATRALRAQGVWMFNVHASSGPEALRLCAAEKGDSIGIVVTVLTSLDERGSRAVFGAESKAKVVEFARWAAEAGMDGVVCSAREVQSIRKCPETSGLITVVPGIRPAWSDARDQARIMSPMEAVESGADYLVLGRPVLNPPRTIGSRRSAVNMVLEEIGKAESRTMV